MEKSEADYQATLRLLEKASSDYWGGFHDAYRTAATELRKLICDRNSLLPRVRPDIKLHQINSSRLLADAPESLLQKISHLVPGRLYLKTGKFELLFTHPAVWLSVEDWVNQRIFDAQTSVREVIKSAADKEGAHSDPTWNDTLERLRNATYFGRESHQHVIVGIADYLSRYLKKCEEQSG